MAEVEQELSTLAREILQNPSFEEKKAKNKLFSKLLVETLKRPESYNYAFDSLQTISILKPEDQSFRLFTWHIVDKNYDEYYGSQQHYYFGLVQRKYEGDGKTEYIVIPLLELQEIPRGVENMLLDNGNWLGAQYYPPKNHEYLPSYTLKFYSRELNSQGKQKKVKQDFYVLLGWNGHDQTSNLKVVEVMSFDPEEKDRVIFGADVFYFDQIPKYRAVFQYSEYAPFSLNFNYVKTPLGGKKEMIVYDHMGMPKMGQQKLKEIWEAGPDGSYDALNFYKRRGYFEWYRHVELAEKYISKQYRKQQEEIRQNQERIAANKAESLENDPKAADMATTLEKNRISTRAQNRASRKAQKQMLREMELKRKREEEKLKQAGIDPSGQN